MKKIIRIIITTLCLCLVTACGTRSQSVNLEKMGKLYSTDDGVSFYYPSNFLINVDSDDLNTVEFVNDNDMLYFKVIRDNSDNMVEDMDDLYSGELEQGGASFIEVSKPVLDSGLDVYLYSFEHSDTGIKSVEIVYFSDEAKYVYGYRSIKDDFDKNEEDMKVYLFSFSKTVGK